MVFDRLDELRALLSAHRYLARARSAYGHRATLMHYLAAHGIETRRRVVSETRILGGVPIVARLLAAAGADVRAEMVIEDRSCDLVELAELSDDPYVSQTRRIYFHNQLSERGPMPVTLLVAAHDDRSRAGEPLSCAK